MTGLGTGFREAQEESSFLSWAVGDAGLSLYRTPPGFLFLFTPLPADPSGGTEAKQLLRLVLRAGLSFPAPEALFVFIY